MDSQHSRDGANARKANERRRRLDRLAASGGSEIDAACNNCAAKRFASTNCEMLGHTIKDARCEI